MSNNNSNNNGFFHSVSSNSDNENKKWDTCNMRQHIASYSFNFEPNGFISSGGRAETTSHTSKFPDYEKELNPLNLINNK